MRMGTIVDKTLSDRKMKKWYKVRAKIRETDEEYHELGRIKSKGNTYTFAMKMAEIYDVVIIEGCR